MAYLCKIRILVNLIGSMSILHVCSNFEDSFHPDPAPPANAHTYRPDQPPSPTVLTCHRHQTGRLRAAPCLPCWPPAQTPIPVCGRRVIKTAPLCTLSRARLSLRSVDRAQVDARITAQRQATCRKPPLMLNFPVKQITGLS